MLQRKIKNPIISIIVFIGASCLLGYAYWKVTGDVHSLTTADKLLPPILMGITGTILVFWSLSGFILRVVQSIKNIYLKGTNIKTNQQQNQYNSYKYECYLLNVVYDNFNTII